MSERERGGTGASARDRKSARERTARERWREQRESERTCRDLVKFIHNSPAPPYGIVHSDNDPHWLCSFRISALYRPASLNEETPYVGALTVSGLQTHCN